MCRTKIVFDIGKEYDEDLYLFLWFKVIFLFVNSNNLRNKTVLAIFKSVSYTHLFCRWSVLPVILEKLF